MSFKFLFKNLLQGGEIKNLFNINENKNLSILIKNNKTRKRIMDEHLRSKNVNIHDMKKYLKRHNLLKSGSYAPNEIIKKIYEESLLSGNIKNKNKENILSNIINN